MKKNVQNQQESGAVDFRLYTFKIKGRPEDITKCLDDNKGNFACYAGMGLIAAGGFYFVKTLFTGLANKLLGVNEKKKKKTDKTEQAVEVTTADTVAPVPAKTLDQLMEESPIDSVEYLKFIGNKILLGTSALLYAQQKSGKSLLNFDIAIAAATGTAPLFLPPEERINNQQPMNVLLYDGENKAETYLLRYKNLSTQDLKRLKIVNRTSFSIDQLFADIRLQLKDTVGNVLVIEDSLSTVLEGFTGSVTMAGQYFNKIKELQDEYRKKGRWITFITVTHTSKKDEESSFGAGNYSNLTDCSLRMERTGSHVWLHTTADRNGGSTGSIQMKFVDEPYLHFEYASSADSNQVHTGPKCKKNKQTEEQEPIIVPPFKDKKERNAWICLMYNNSGKNQGEIAELLNLRRETVCNIINNQSSQDN